MPNPPATPNGHHGDAPAGLKRPAPFPVPSVAAQMAEADAAAQAAMEAELQRRAKAVHDHIAVLLHGDPGNGVEPDPAGLIMAIPDLFFGSLVEALAQAVQIGLQRAAEAEQKRMQEAQAPEQVAARKPILLAQTGNVRMAAQAAMTGMPPGTPG